MIKTTDDVDWNAVEKYYHQRWSNESADTQQRIRHIRFD